MKYCLLFVSKDNLGNLQKSFTQNIYIRGEIKSLLLIQQVEYDHLNPTSGIQAHFM